MPHPLRSQTLSIVSTSATIAAIIFVAVLCITTLPGPPW